MVGGRVNVVLRVRPGTGDTDGDAWAGAAGAGAKLSVSQKDNTARLHRFRYEGEDLLYQFDRVFGEKATQEDIFEAEVAPMLGIPFEARNATIFCYGATGAGKTHTMQGTAAAPGIIPRAMRALLARLPNPKTTTLVVSYLEVYKEKVYDLLEPKESDLQIRETAQKEIVIPGLSETAIVSIEDFETRFQKALMNRSVAATKLNERSSRSHAILVVKITTNDGKTVRVGKLNLIDLAGSEDGRRSGTSGERLQEAGAINTSLFVLNNVVDALNKKQARVPYRDSKLTRLLQDSLGGTAEAKIFCNIAPEASLETHNTLNFASKSRNVVNDTARTHATAVAAPGVPAAAAAAGMARKRPLSADLSAEAACAEPPGKRPRLNSSSSADAVHAMTPSSKARMARAMREQAAVLSKYNGELASKLLSDAASLLTGPTARAPLRALGAIGNATAAAAAAGPVKKEAAAAAAAVAVAVAGKISSEPAAKKRRRSSECDPDWVVPTDLAQQEDEDEDGDEDEDEETENTAPASAAAAAAAPAPGRKGKRKRSSGECAAAPLEPLTPGRQARVETRLLDILKSGSLRDLTALHVVGKKRAQAILDYRSERPDAFAKLADLRWCGFGNSKLLESFVQKNAAMASS